MVWADVIDDVSGGNGDGMVNPGETISYGVYAKNIGSIDAQQVYGLLSESDTFVAVAVDSSWYGDISASDSSLSNPYYTFSVTENCPDGHEIPLVIDFHDGNDSVFTSHRSIRVHAPVLIFHDVQVVNDNNSNGFLGPGETANLIVTLKNDGGQDAEGINSVLEHAYASSDRIFDER